MSAPTETHREEARELARAAAAAKEAGEWLNSAAEPIAAALAAAEKRGMERAAEIAEDIEVEKPGLADIAPRQFDAGVCTAQIAISEAIFSETTQSPPHSPGAGEARDGHLSSGGPSRATNLDSTRDAT